MSKLETTEKSNIIAAINKMNSEVAEKTTDNSEAAKLAYDKASEANKKALEASEKALAGGELKGILKAQSNDAYETPQVRNIIVSPLEPSDNEGDNGDIWFIYE